MSTVDEKPADKVHLGEWPLAVAAVEILGESVGRERDGGTQTTDLDRL